VFAALAFPVMGFGFALALWTGISAGRSRPTGEIQMASVLLLEAALLAQSVIGWLRIGGSGIDEPVTFVAYSIGILAPMAAAFYLARIERTRWGSIIVCFAAVVVAVMTLRLAALWGLLGG
jgi:hypothetical protein